jgi:murein DD-endopeptidase MepM/ murein hydrolase activator NlpD
VLGVVLDSALVVWQACATRSAPRPAFGGEVLAIQELQRRRLEFPVAGAVPSELRDSFHDARGRRVHQAVDIPAPRGTPVRAVEDGTISKLFESPKGGISVYQFDPAGRYCYYYAHLLGYAAGLREGQKVKRSEVIGFVGTTGNAPPNAPHLHFAIFLLDESKQWWKGTAIDPLLALR